MVILETKQQKFLNLFNILFNNNNDAYSYDSDDTIQDSEKYSDVSITIT